MSNFFYTADGKKMMLENFADAIKTPNIDDSLRLKGNLALDGSLKATKFILDDGSEMRTVVQEQKVTALPNNVTFDAQGNMNTSGNVFSSKGFQVEGPDNLNKYSLDKNGVNTIGTQGWWTVFRQHSNEGWKFNNEKNETIKSIRAANGDTQMKGSLAIESEDLGKIQTPNGQLRINKHGIMLGGNNASGYEINSAQISAGIHVPNSLNIVGMGRTGGERKIDMWAEGGLRVNGSTTVTGNSVVNGQLCVGSVCANEAKFKEMSNPPAPGAGVVAANSPIEVTAAGNDKIQGPNGKLRMNNQGIMFGGPNNGYEVNSAQISAGLHDANSLCIVGMGKNAAERKITMWAESGMNLYGSATINGKLRINGKIDNMVDNRAQRLNPGQYRAMGIGEVTEFKDNYDGNLPGYTYVKTLIPWPDPSGGKIKQIGYHDSGVFYRVAVDEATWGPWKKMVTNPA